MEKKQYERLKSLRDKVAKGTATFAERNIMNMENKKARKAAKEAAAKVVPVQTKSTKRFGKL